MRWPGHIAQLGEQRNMHKVLEVKPEEKRSLGRTVCSCFTYTVVLEFNLDLMEKKFKVP